MHFLRLLLAAWLALGILVWLVRVMVSEGQFVFGMYRRHMKTIGYLGQIDKLYVLRRILTLRCDLIQDVIERFLHRAWWTVGWATGHGTDRLLP